MIKNVVTLHNGYVTIEVFSKNVFRGKVFLDTEDLSKVGKVRISNTGYAYQCGEGGKSVANVVMDHDSSRKIVVDHINSNRSDNRKSNLRIVSQQQNTQARKTFNRNNTGEVGISYRCNGLYEYYRVCLTHPATKKRINKQFNINKLGKQEAFVLAKRFLEDMKVKLGYCV